MLTRSSDLMLQVWTPNVITFWEALLTVLQYGLLLIHAYAQDKRWPYLSLPMYVFSLSLPLYVFSFFSFWSIYLFSNLVFLCLLFCSSLLQCLQSKN